MSNYVYEYKILIMSILLNINDPKATFIDTKMLSDTISEHVFFKAFLAAYTYHQSSSMLCMLSVLPTLHIANYAANYTYTTCL